MSFTDQLSNICHLSNIEYEVYTNYEFSIPIPPNEDCIFQLSYDQLNDIIQHNINTNWFDIFFKNNNSYLLIDQEIDLTMDLLKLIDKGRLNLLKKYKKRIIFFYTGILENNIKNSLFDFNLIKKQESEFFVRMPNYYYNNKIRKLKLQRENKFLLTTIIREKYHRSLLVDYLENKNLIKHHTGKIHYSKHNMDHNWVGDKHSIHNWNSGIISWDLYSRSSFEIVPETLYKDATFITEKTLKPIIARIPFLVLSNQQFYHDLKKLGFKTFDSLVDESFAYETDIIMRTKKLVELTKNIINNNALEFNTASKEICDYNFDHLLYLKSKDEYNSYFSYFRLENYVDNIF